MPAGSFGAGTGLAGFDPVEPLSETPFSRPPNALLFDPNTRDFRLGADGRFVSVDPVDQEVALALWIRQNSLGSVPGAGSRLRSIARAGGPSLISETQDIVRQALKRLTDRKAIQIDQIDVTTPVRGKILVIVTYENLEIQTPRPKSKAATLLV